jgi:hypothetical protein
MPVAETSQHAHPPGENLDKVNMTLSVLVLMISKTPDWVLNQEALAVELNHLTLRRVDVLATEESHCHPTHEHCLSTARANSVDFQAEEAVDQHHSVSLATLALATVAFLRL